MGRDLAGTTGEGPLCPEKCKEIFLMEQKSYSYITGVCPSLNIFGLFYIMSALRV